MGTVLDEIEGSGRVDRKLSEFGHRESDVGRHGHIGRHVNNWN